MRRFLASAWYPFSICLVLAGATFVAAFVGVVTFDVGNAEIQNYAYIAGDAAGPVTGLLSFLAISILNVVRRILRLRKVQWLHPVIVLIGIVPWVVFAWILTGEPEYTPIGRAVVWFVARPLLWGSLIATIVAVILSLPIFFQSFGKLRTGSGSLLLIVAFTSLTGCLGDVMEVLCAGTPDEDHCFQAAAVQESKPETCAKVAGEAFVGQNPPRDKCYLQIAEHNGDPTVCDKIEGGITSYSKEECLDNVYRNHTVDSCDKAEDQIACRTAYARKFGECGDGFYLSKKTNTCVKREPGVTGSDDDIESKVEGDLNTIKDAATGKYMELLEGAIESETDPSKLAGLQAYKEFLEKGGEQLENVGTTVDQLKEIKKIFLDAYDPSMDVEKMPVNKILDPGLFDNIKSRLFGDDPPSERAKADDALSVYEAMLKRQGEIDFLKKGKMDRLTETITSKVKDKLTGDLTEKITGIVESAAGPAFKAVTFVGDAVKSFQEEAQKEMFVGLAAAYNRQRDAIKQSNAGLDAEELHKRTVQSVKENPYADNPNAGFVKYGNILENPDCQDGGNPLCIDDRVFWTAMDKAYVYTHK